MKTYDVFLDSGISVDLPDDTDPESAAGYEALKAAAAARFTAMLEEDSFDITYEEFVTE